MGYLVAYPDGCRVPMGHLMAYNPDGEGELLKLKEMTNYKDGSEERTKISLQEAAVDEF